MASDGSAYTTVVQIQTLFGRSYSDLRGLIDMYETFISKRIFLREKREVYIEERLSQERTVIQITNKHTQQLKKKTVKLSLNKLKKNQKQKQNKM